MKLKQLVERLNYTLVQGTLEQEITVLTYDSRKVIPGSVFVCISGNVFDGHNYVEEVASKGATVVIVERDVVAPKDVTVIKVDSTRIGLAYTSAAYFGHPAEKLKTIGITGTKGKTTTTYMVRSILENAGIKTGLIGTIEIITPNEVIPASHTTPESYQLQEYLKKMVDAGCEAVAMEVSSQGLMLNRVAGFTFDYGIFTNISPDHISPTEHKDFDDYLNCKAMLFKACKIGILNGDDSNVEKILQGHTCQVETFGMTDGVDIQAVNVDLHNASGALGVRYDVKTKENSFPVAIPIPGAFTVYNSLTAIAICRHFNIPEENVVEALQKVRVKGRVEPIHISEKFSLMIDYAHNAMSLESLLTTLREYNPTRLICLFGCGGNRSKLRRFEMGEISSNCADLTVVTSDNPRDEEPQDILNDIITGVKKGSGEYISIIDRKEAIRYCITNAKEGDLIVLAGKGHEDYQEIKGVKYKMDERDLIKEILAELKEEGFQVI